ncbi:MAG: hypothetical protein GY761_17895 [Hyphomicrobiales bacterium]|nr:hypothetical protein [Hyphomicrobiales bacterium]
MTKKNQIGAATLLYSGHRFCQTVIQIVVLVFACLFNLSLPQTAFSQDWIESPIIEKIVTVEGETLTLRIQPDFRIIQQANSEFQIVVRASTSLAEIQDKTVSILQNLVKRKSRCETRLSFPQLGKPVHVNGSLRISGSIRAEIWLCTSFLKTRLGRETANFEVDIRPNFTDDSVGFEAQLINFDLGNSILPNGELENIVRRFVEANSVFKITTNEIREELPVRITSINPKFTALNLQGESNGNASIHGEAEAPLDKALLDELFKLLVD